MYPAKIFRLAGEDQITIGITIIERPFVQLKRIMVML